MRISRTDRSLLADWWFTVDKVLLTAILVLMGGGLILSLAASPAVALKKGLPAFHFAARHLAFATIGLVLLFIVSLMPHRYVRRTALIVFGVMVAAMLAVVISGDEINGARRWLLFAGFSVQPSELAKPCFVILCAWAFAETLQRPDMPARTIAIALYTIMATLLILQPDVGQTILISIVWGTLFILSGQPLVWAAGLVVAGMAGLAVAYISLAYVRLRVDRFFSPSADETSQTARALQSFIEGGFFGRGPGEGTIKTALPDAHTDFIFAVIAEEYGALACLALVALFALIVLRAYLRTIAEPDPFVRLTVAGLSVMFGLQAAINMAVNVGLLPAKGMTLPFISSGGSSLISVSLLAGMLLALTRRRPEASRLRRPQLPLTTESLGELGSRMP